ncbi:MAG: S8 family serine peptidase [Thaumarchaeota archaeon]|nr:S8 family serine peptidase [Nitrososphaerota archaeon]
MRHWLIVLLFAFLLLTAGTVPVFSAGPPSNPGPATHIVVFHDNVDPSETAKDLAKKHGLTIEFIYNHALLGASFIIPPPLEEDVRSDPRVAFMEKNQRVAIFSQTLPTGVNRIDAEGSSNPVDVDIAIIDTGIDLDHPDLNVVASTNCAQGGPFNNQCEDGKGDDGNGHGTHVAGIASALDNTIGVVGVAAGAKLWAVKVLDNSGSGWMSWIIAGVDWVTSHAGEIEVANMSLGCECKSDALDKAIANSVNAGVTYVVAAGNSAKDAKDFSPANHPDVITVSAIADSDGKCGKLGPSTKYGADDTFASFSNFGSLIEQAAPGVDLYSTYKDGGYATMSGTSMASPHVAGAAGRYKAANPSATPAQVRDALINGGVAQTKSCDTSLNNGDGGFTGDPDAYPEPLVYAGSSALTVSGLSVSPNPFSPNGDGAKDTTTISFNLNKAADWTVSVSDRTWGGSVSGAATVSVVWDGKDSAGAVVADGSYTVSVSATSGSESASTSTSVTVDNAAPTLSDVGTSNISSSSADITWVTNEAADSLVEYGTASGSYTSQVSDPTLVTSHKVTLINLQASTTYYYRITSVDVAGNKVVSGEYSFTTLAAPSGDSSKMGAFDISWESNRHLTFTVNVKRDSDASGSLTSSDSPVSKASVKARLIRDSNGDGNFDCSSGDECWEFSGETNDSGNRWFRLLNAPSGNYKAEVIGLTHASYTWDKALDKDNPDYFTR